MAPELTYNTIERVAGFTISSRCEIGTNSLQICVNRMYYSAFQADFQQKLSNFLSYGLKCEDTTCSKQREVNCIIQSLSAISSQN
jgi:hypothetical protein